MSFEQVRTRWSKQHLEKAVDFLDRQSPRGKLTEVYEFGVYRSESLSLIGDLFYSRQLPHSRSFGFDSFQGLPAEEKGVDRFYLFEPGMFADVTHLWPTRNAVYIKGWFKDLTSQHVAEYGMEPAAMVHVDGDLYISAVQALDFMFSNNLISQGTVIAYDEFKSTDKLEAGGESLAHMHIAKKWKVKFREFFRNVYFDRLDMWQNAFVVEGVGVEDWGHGIHGVN